MCDVVYLGGKDNGLEPGNRISVPFDLEINMEHLPPMGSLYEDCSEIIETLCLFSFLIDVFG
jgi:hypothetical protein